MPSVSYDGQSFQINGQRIWLYGASLPYAFVPPDEWAPAINRIAEAGFNLVDAFVPWLLHEPRRGTFDFSGPLDLQRFVGMCGERGLRVLLRVGPYVGGRIDGGGLPPWLSETPGMRLRQGNELFLERVGHFYQRLFAEVVELQATRPTTIPALGSRGGPLLLVQMEHGWHCANDDQGRRYLQELVRYVRECGITVPLLSANDLWQDVEGTIETWTGSEDLLVNLRQLRDVQSHAPRLVTNFDPCGFEVWGEGEPQPHTVGEMLVRLGQILAAGGQAVVTPYHPGTHYGFTAGRLAGGPGRFSTTRPAVDAPLDEAGRPGPKHAALKRLVNFAVSFGHVFAELDPDYHPVTVDIETMLHGSNDPRERYSAGQPTISVVPLRGPQGRLVFVFSGNGGSGKSAPRDTTLLLENGIRLPVHLGDQPLGWFALDVDLLGKGHLDFANLCPFAFVDRSILVLQGPAGAAGYLSINGGPLEILVPERNDEPRVVVHKDITIVVCNQRQIDATVHDGTAVYVGTDGLEPDGAPRTAAGFRRVHRIARGGAVSVVKPASASRTPPAPKLGPWTCAPADQLVDGRSARYATLDGPASLAQCGAPSGYGWYRMELKGSPAKRVVQIVEGGDRFLYFLNGAFQGVLGAGPGAARLPFDVKSTRAATVVLLADNLGRFAEGNDAGEHKGLAGPVVEIKPLKGVRTSRVDAAPADPFLLRGFIIGRSHGQAGGTRQVQWSFLHRRKSRVLVTISGLRQAGTLVLNDKPLAYYAGATGAMLLSVVLDPATTEAMRSGQNHLRFSPDPTNEPVDEDPSKSIALSEVVRDLGSDGRWAFARFEPPVPTAFRDPKSLKIPKACPCWWRTSFEAPKRVPLLLDVSTLSKGQVYLNGRALGRYFTASATGAKVGPQTALHIPPSWLREDGRNDLLVFDEHGFAPKGVALYT
ncbi:MAG: beta-galactosidase [Phycisphaerales bacterium]|nr:beta-galactosidase [Phycisphaerales bacterium]